MPSAGFEPTTPATKRQHTYNSNDTTQRYTRIPEISHLKVSTVWKVSGGPEKFTFWKTSGEQFPGKLSIYPSVEAITAVLNKVS
jgi:hypothetical protein